MGYFYTIKDAIEEKGDDMLNVEHVSGGYDSILAVEDVSFQVEPGETLGIIGPNGSGKSTLLKMIYGGIKLDSGNISIHQKPLHSFSQKKLAKKIAVLPQHMEETFSYTVRDVVELGRYPHQQGWFSRHTMEDEKIMENAMKETNVHSFANHSLDSLSGGEKQRVFLARALTQEPEILLLDEPTNHLDISFQLSLLDTLKQWTKSKNLTVIAVLHDLNMAGLYSDRLLLLENGKQKALDKPGYVLEKEQLENVYKASLQREEHASVPRPLISLEPAYSNLSEMNLSLDQLTVNETEKLVCIESPFYWKTFSSAVIGAGFGWHRYFVNRHVEKNYHVDDVRAEFEYYLQKEKYDVADTAAMMTAAVLYDGSFVRVHGYPDIFVYVTAGISNAVDASLANQKETTLNQNGTINGWIFIDGTLTEAAYAQVMMTATEAKSKALFDKNIFDKETGTMATGTSTDSLLVAASQTGPTFEYGGTISPLGKKWQNLYMKQSAMH
ncbi:iron complex transport system ATP-binding protein [Salibacterium salarium]|uniref:adenosylcobinamide amidohydrolase n=1 Tax=Salibacterium salarium TaxID=284579 RepID=UPI002783769A|nr:adenosylcobinamide amidohydrolase [Salibacterium salarium]MDQ0299491.1 iron complex transport system ATP-binding protein [Salibacterium salarium]